MAYSRDAGVVYSAHGHGSQEGMTWYPIFVFEMIPLRSSEEETRT